MFNEPLLRLRTRIVILRSCVRVVSLILRITVLRVLELVVVVIILSVHSNCERREEDLPVIESSNRIAILHFTITSISYILIESIGHSLRLRGFPRSRIRSSLIRLLHSGRILSELRHIRVVVVHVILKVIERAQSNVVVRREVLRRHLHHRLLRLCFRMEIQLSYS